MHLGDLGIGLEDKLCQQLAPFQSPLCRYSGRSARLFAIRITHRSVCYNARRRVIKGASAVFEER